MTTLYTLTHPSLSGADVAAIEAIRREHDPQCEMVKAHFALVFGCRYAMRCIKGRWPGI